MNANDFIAKKKEVDDLGNKVLKLEMAIRDNDELRKADEELTKKAELPETTSLYIILQNCRVKLKELSNLYEKKLEQTEIGDWV